MATPRNFYLFYRLMMLTNETLKVVGDILNGDKS
jgi:hypothetical protein